MFGVIARTQKHLDESLRAFVGRKNRLLNETIPQHQRWSFVWAKRVVSWHEHVLRNTNGACWSSQIAAHRNAGELANLRRLNNDRPAVRCAAGFTAKRWYEAVADASAL